MYAKARAVAAGRDFRENTDGVGRRPSYSRMPCVWNADPGGSSTTCAAAIPLPAKSPAKIEEISNLLLMVFSLSML